MRWEKRSNWEHRGITAIRGNFRLTRNTIKRFRQQAFLNKWKLFHLDVTGSKLSSVAFSMGTEISGTYGCIPNRTVQTLLDSLFNHQNNLFNGSVISESISLFPNLHSSFHPPPSHTYVFEVTAISKLTTGCFTSFTRKVDKQIRMDHHKCQTTCKIIYLQFCAIL